MRASPVNTNYSVYVTGLGWIKARRGQLSFKYTTTINSQVKNITTFGINNTIQANTIQANYLKFELKVPNLNRKLPLN